MDAVHAGRETEARTEGYDLLLQQEEAEVREAVGDAAGPEGRREQADGPAVPEGQVGALESRTNAIWAPVKSIAKVWDRTA